MFYCDFKSYIDFQQKTHQQIAEEKQLHLVELRKEEGNFPKVVASPSVCRTAEQIKADEVMDFKQVFISPVPDTVCFVNFYVFVSEMVVQKITFLLKQ